MATHAREVKRGPRRTPAGAARAGGRFVFEISPAEFPGLPSG